MLPESVKSKSSKSSKKGNASGSSKLPPVCYEIITLRSKKKKKMAADIFPTKKPASSTTVQQYQQQNLNNNNTIQNCNWQGLYSTIRERWVQPARTNCFCCSQQFSHIKHLHKVQVIKTACSTAL